MTMSPNSAIVDALIRHEGALASLYQAYATAFPETRDFWRQLVLEERAHADVLRTLKRFLITNGISLNPARFNAVALKISMESVTKTLERLKHGDMTLINAVAIALGLEQAMVEHDFFKVFEYHTPGMNKEAEDMRLHVQEHLGKLVHLLEKQRRTPA